MKNTMQLYSNMYLQVTDAAYIQGDRWWEDQTGRIWWNRSCINDYDMLYYVKVGRFNLHLNGHCYCLQAGQMAYIPAGSRLIYDFDGTGPLEKYYTHFYLSFGKRAIAECFDFSPIITVKDSTAADRLFSGLIDCSDNLGLAQKGFLLQLISLFLHESHIAPRKVDPMQLAIQYIYEHRNENISVAKMAQLSGYSKDHFTRKFKETYGRTPQQYIGDVRFEQAKELLLLSDMNVAQIAASLGFCDAGYFTNFFYTKAGITPSYYRKREKLTCRSDINECLR